MLSYDIYYTSVVMVKEYARFNFKKLQDDFPSL